MKPLLVFPHPLAVVFAVGCVPVVREIAALSRPCFIDTAFPRLQKNTALVGVFLKDKMASFKDKAIAVREIIKGHFEQLRNPPGLSVFKIDKTGLFATNAAALTLEVFHKRKGDRLLFRKKQPVPLFLQ